MTGDIFIYFFSGVCREHVGIHRTKLTASGARGVNGPSAHIPVAQAPSIKPEPVQTRGELLLK